MAGENRNGPTTYANETSRNRIDRGRKGSWDAHLIVECRDLGGSADGGRARGAVEADRGVDDLLQLAGRQLGKDR